MNSSRAALFGALIASGFAVSNAAPAPDACPYLLKNTNLQAGEKVACNCREAEVSSGLIFGTDVYSEASTTCRAALHAEAVGEKGGEVTIHAGGTCELFLGTDRNGVSSNELAGKSPSYAFVDPIPPCPEIAARQKSDADQRDKEAAEAATLAALKKQIYG